MLCREYGVRDKKAGFGRFPFGLRPPVAFADSRQGVLRGEMNAEIFRRFRSCRALRAQYSNSRTCSAEHKGSKIKSWHGKVSDGPPPTWCSQMVARVFFGSEMIAESIFRRFRSCGALLRNIQIPGHALQSIRVSR